MMSNEDSLLPPPPLTATAEAATASQKRPATSTIIGTSPSPSPPTSHVPTFEVGVIEFTIGQLVDVKWPNLESQETWPGKIVERNWDNGTYTVSWGDGNTCESNVHPNRISPRKGVLCECFEACVSCHCCLCFESCCSGGGGGNCDECAGACCFFCYQTILVDFFCWYTCGERRFFNASYIPLEICICPCRAAYLALLVTINVAFTVVGTPLACLCMPICGGRPFWDSYANCIIHQWTHWPKGENDLSYRGD